MGYLVCLRQMGHMGVAARTQEGGVPLSAIQHNLLIACITSMQCAVLPSLLEVHTWS